MCVFRLLQAETNCSAKKLRSVCFPNTMSSVSVFVRQLISLLFFLLYLFNLIDNFIQKTKQRYNSPRSLSTKINLADMQTEIKLRPPYQLTPEDLSFINGFSQSTASKYKGIGTDPTLCLLTLIETINTYMCSAHYFCY